MTFMGLEARKDLPKVTYPTALDYFVFISFMYIFSTVVQVQPYSQNILGTNTQYYLVWVGAPLHQAGVWGVLPGGAGGGALPQAEEGAGEEEREAKKSLASHNSS